MPPKKKTPLQSQNNSSSSARTGDNTSVSDHACLCKICDEAIIEPKGKKKGDDSIFCSGDCDGWVHRRCAGPKKAKFIAYTNTDESVKFFCPTCRIDRLEAAMIALKEELDSTRTEIELLKANPHANIQNKSFAQAASGSNPSIITTCRSDSQERKQPSKINHVATSTRKSNLVIFGLKELPKGTKRHERLSSDIEEATNLLSCIDPIINDYSVRECVRLGNYDQNHCRPVLAMLNRPRDVASILSKKASCVSLPPNVQIRPDLSKEERAIKACLLKERRELINSGTERSQISIRRNKLFIGERLYGEVVDLSFQKGPLVSDFISSALDSSINTQLVSEGMTVSSQEASQTVDQDSTSEVQDQSRVDHLPAVTLQSDHSSLPVDGSLLAPPSLEAD